MKTVLQSLLLGSVASATTIPQSVLAGTPSLSLSGANLTTKWIDGTKYTQIIELWVENNDAYRYVTGRDALTLSVESDSLETAVTGHLKRLAPGQRSKVHVGVRNKAGVKAGSNCSGKIIAQSGRKSLASGAITGLCGIADYEPTAGSLNTHRSPDWFDDIKYGIFIHWGVYSVPAYGNTGSNENYAEWYWKWMNNKNDKTQTYQYHLDHYGANVNYDDFIANFTAAKFDPKEWVDLFSNAGAQYFVPTTKHHDGWAIFNTSATITRRSTVNYGPKRDLLRELFDAAKKYQPHLRRGTYFSLPQWYNTAYYNILPGSSWAGTAPVNPYTKQEIPYTGSIEKKDFINEIQAPQMNELAYGYGTEMMWCDINSPSNSSYMLSEWINWAKANGQQVSFNARCSPGDIHGDFATPEYAPNPENFQAKWESSRGMDPHSYGYNQVTPDDEYLNGSSISTTLIDIVSKNGNFLLDIGPRGDGSIPEIMQKGLLDAGAWIKEREESIFGTQYWSTTQANGPFRYTHTSDAFYIHHIGQPPKDLSIPDPVPFLPLDGLQVLGGKADGDNLTYDWTNTSGLLLHLTDDMVDGDRYVWTFKIAYNH